MEALARTVPPRALAREGVGVILVASLLFGTMALFVRLAAREMPAVQVTFVRFVGSLVILLVTTRGRGLVRRGPAGPLILRGLIGAAAIALYFIAIAGAGAGLATLLQNGYPVFAASFAALLLRESFSARLMAALTLNLTGLGLVLAPEARLHPTAVIGALAACASALLSGGAVVAARHLRRTESASVITTWFMAVGMVVTAPALASGLPPPSVALVLALAGVIVTSVAGQWLLHHRLGFISVARGSLMAATSVINRGRPRGGRARAAPGRTRARRRLLYDRGRRARHRSAVIPEGRFQYVRAARSMVPKTSATASAESIRLASSGAARRCSI